MSGSAPGIPGGSMQGLGATGTGISPGGGQQNSLLQQLMLARLMALGGGGGQGAFQPQAPMGMIGANPHMGMAPQAPMMAGGGGGGMQQMPGMASALGGLNPQMLQQLLAKQTPGGSSFNGWLSGLLGTNVGGAPPVGTETMTPYWQGLMSGSGLRG